MKQMIWSSYDLLDETAKEEYQNSQREILDDDSYEVSDEEWAEEVYCRLDDERSNLNKEVDGIIVVFGNLGLWNGRRQGYQILGSTIADILKSQCDDAEWYGDGYNIRKYSINSLVYWVTYVHNVVYSFYRSMIYCYINSTQRCAGSIVIDIIPTNGADKRKFFPFAPYFPVTNVIKRYFYPYFPAIIGIKGYSFPYFPYLSGIMKIKTALYSLFSRLDWHKTVVFPCLGEIYEGIRSLSWEIPVT